MSNKEILKHIRCGKGDIAPYVIIPGDPGRVKRIVEQMDSAEFLVENREYIVYTGEYKGTPVTVCSSGIGGPAASIAIEELIKLGAKVFIRVGSAGGRQPETPIGTPIVITAAFRGEGTSKAYLPVEFPAAASLDVTNALVTSCGVKAAEQEAAILFIIGSVRGVKTGAVVSSDSNIWLKKQPTLEEKEKAFMIGEKKTIRAALDAAKILYDQGAHQF
jgi:uridine phosphorylase